MRWKRPRIGDRRVRKGFLFQARTDFDTFTVRWLEYAYYVEQYVRDTGMGGHYWMTEKWITREEYEEKAKKWK